MEKDAHIDVGSGTTHTLYIDTPFLLVQAKCLEGSLLAQSFGLIYEFIASIVTRAGVAFGVLVWRNESAVSSSRWHQVLSLHTLHNATQSVQNSLGGEVLGGNEVDKVLLPIFLLEIAGVVVRRL